MPKIHDLKILPAYFDDVAKGRKTFELRFDDRGYFEGDLLLLREWENGAYTGRRVVVMTLCGGVVALALLVTGHKPKRFHYLIYFEVGSGWGGFELGAFFVVNKNPSLHILQHESGHGLQNIMLGVFMPFIVSIPSCIRYWWREYKMRKGLGNTLPPYDRIWFEGWATRLGEKHFN